MTKIIVKEMPPVTAIRNQRVKFGLTQRFVGIDCLTGFWKGLVKRL